MVFKETFETPIETERELQRFLTFLEEHKFYGQKALDEGKYIKSYAEEVQIEGSLNFLNKFLKNQIEENAREIKKFKEGVAIESLKMKCQQISKWIEFEDEEDENEDFGDDD